MTNDDICFFPSSHGIKLWSLAINKTKNYDDPSINQKVVEDETIYVNFRCRKIDDKK